MAQLKIVADKTAMSETAAERVTRLVEAAIAARGVAAISLTGGTTPDLLYQFLADRSRPWRDRIDWAHVHLFWSDEREVPPDHPQSNFGLANRLLLQHVPVPDTQIHRMRVSCPRRMPDLCTTRCFTRDAPRLPGRCLTSCCWGLARTRTLLRSFRIVRC
jgi:6-phosphogluconolactonase